MSLVTVSNTSKLVGKTTQLLFITTAMSIVTISKASRLVGRTTQTLYRHISTGKLRRTQEGVETDELKRVYGDLKLQHKPETERAQLPPPETDNEFFLQEQIRELQMEMREMREYYEKKEDRLLRIIETKLMENMPKPGWFSRLFK